MKTAKKITDLTNFTGHAALFELSEPLDGASTVVVSATTAYGTHETYIFPADAGGNITDWGELNGSTRGTLSHKAALENAGYELV